MLNATIAQQIIDKINKGRHGRDEKTIPPLKSLRAIGPIDGAELLIDRMWPATPRIGAK